jgi:adenosylmethionine-8-amino-7-oxononanoate aminotransferase
MRIAPPMIITETEISKICSIIVSSIEETYSSK